LCESHVHDIIWKAWNQFLKGKGPEDEEQPLTTNRRWALARWDELLSSPRNPLSAPNEVRFEEEQAWILLESDLRYYKFRNRAKAGNKEQWLKAENVVAEGQVLPDALFTKHERLLHIGTISGFRDALGIDDRLRGLLK
jgi:hypothetical protein